MSDFESRPTLSTERLRLRPLVAEDAERLASIANDRRIARNLTAAFPHPYTRADAEGFIGSGAADGGFAIDPIGGDGIVGMIGGSTHQVDNPLVHTFGYWLGVDHWGRGYATEASRAYVDHIVATTAPIRIEASVYGWNPASGRVLEKVGFTHEATLARRIRRFDEVTDELIYVRLID